MTGGASGPSPYRTFPMRLFIALLIGAFLAVNLLAYWAESTIRSGELRWGGKTYWIVEQLDTGGQP